MVRPHQEILSSTTNSDDFYVVKLNEKLHDKILEVLESFGCIQNSQEFKFNYYHTTSDDTTEHEVKVFSVAKGLLARLNPQDSIPQNEFPRNKWIPYSIKYILESDLTDAHTTFPENTQAYTVVPLFEDKGHPITLKLSLRGKRSEMVDVALQNGNAYIVWCKNHKGDKTCKLNSIRCAFHCNEHKLCYEHEKIPQSVIILYILPGPEDVKPPSVDTDEILLNMTGGEIWYKKALYQLRDNVGDGLCLLDSFKDFILYVSKSTPVAVNMQPRFLDENQKRGYSIPHVIQILLEFLGTSNEKDFDALLLYYNEVNPSEQTLPPENNKSETDELQEQTSTSEY
jgi:hypothetical protein